MFLRASVLHVCLTEVDDDKEVFWGHREIPPYYPLAPSSLSILSCHSRAVMEEETADNLGLIQFQFSTVKGVVAPNVIQQIWWRGARGDGVSSIAVHDQRFSSWDLLYVFFSFTKLNLSFCAGHCLVTERKLSCNAAACLNMASGAFLGTPELDVDFSWILKDFFSSSRVQCGSMHQGNLCILACPVTIFCSGSCGWRE